MIVKNNKPQKEEKKNTEVRANFEESKPALASKMTYIRLEDIKNYVGKMVWYDVKNMLGDGFLPIRNQWIKTLDETNNKIIYAGNEGFDNIDMYEKAYIFWEKEPSEEERKACWNSKNA